VPRQVKNGRSVDFGLESRLQLGQTGGDAFAGFQIVRRGFAGTEDTLADAGRA